jgi:hypothetical protein
VTINSTPFQSPNRQGQNLLTRKTAPNKAPEPSAYSSGFAYASGGGSALAFGLQSKLFASLCAGGAGTVADLLD